MKIYKVTCYVSNLDRSADTANDVRLQLLNNRYPAFLQIGSIKETDIGEYDDNHPTNKLSTDLDEWWELNVKR